MSNVNALLGGMRKRGDGGGAPLWTGTITAVAGSNSISVLIDGAETAVTVIKGPSGALVDDRVIVTRIGRSLYLVVNLTRT